MVDGQNWHSQSALSWENPQNSATRTAEGLMAGNVVALGPLASIWCSVMACATAHQPSCMVKGSVSKICQTYQPKCQLPVSVNMASLVSPKLRPSPKDCLP